MSNSRAPLNLPSVPGVCRLHVHFAKVLSDRNTTYATTSRPAHACAPCRSSSRPRNRFACCADLPDDELRVRLRRARRRSLRARGIRQHLHAPDESHDRRAGETAGRHGGRNRGAGRLKRHVRDFSGHYERVCGGRSHHRVEFPVRRHRSTVSAHAPAFRDRCHVCR